MPEQKVLRGQRKDEEEKTKLKGHRKQQEKMKM